MEKCLSAHVSFTDNDKVTDTSPYQGEDRELSILEAPCHPLDHNPSSDHFSDLGGPRVPAFPGSVDQKCIPELLKATLPAFELHIRGILRMSFVSASLRPVSVRCVHTATC